MTEPVASAQLRLRLYVADDGPNSTAAIANLDAALAGAAPGTVELEIIDVVHDPERGLRDGILVTPMLVKTAPGPERRILGNLKDRARLLAMLELPVDAP